MIPVYGRSDLTAMCLASLARAGDDVEIVVVDNASTDDTPELLARVAPDATVVRNTANLGFATACNQGAVAASAEVVVFLNNDTEVSPGWLEPVLEELEDPSVGVVGSRLLFPGGRIQHAGLGVAPGGVLHHIHKGAPGDLEQAARRRDLQIVTGACLAMRRPDVLELGGFSTEYRNGYEDADLCLRVRSRGLRVRLAGDSVVVHHEGQSLGRFDHDDANAAIFRRRWARWPADLADLLAEDGVEDGVWGDSLWVGRLLDGSEEAAEGRAVIARLTAEGRRPRAIEVPDAGPCVDACPLDLLAALNRFYLPVAEPLQWVAGGRHAPGLPGVPVPPEAVRPGDPEPDTTARRLMRMGEPRPGLRWIGHLSNRSGYATASRRSIEAGRRAGLAFAVGCIGDAPATGIGSAGEGVPGPVYPFATVINSPVHPTLSAMARERFGGRLVWASCFEADRLPAPWVETLAEADQVWVPSGFNARTFAASGVPEDRIRVVPYPIDVDGPAAMPRRRDDGRFVAVSVFEWTWRKGWDVLLSSWIEEFRPEDPVLLRILTYRGLGALGKGPGIEGQVGRLLERLGRSPESLPDIEIITTPLSEADLAAFYADADAFVLPTRGEGAGLPVLEAMAAGIPVVATAYGGYEEFMESDLAFPVPVARMVPAPQEMLQDNPVYAGLSLAEPDGAALRGRLREVFEDRAEARRRAARGREAVIERISLQAAGPVLRERVVELLDLRPGAVRV